MTEIEYRDGHLGAPEATSLLRCQQHLHPAFTVSFDSPAKASVQKYGIPVMWADWNKAGSVFSDRNPGQIGAVSHSRMLGLHQDSRLMKIMR